MLRQWHPEKNEGLTPTEISYGSQKKIWWRCDRGHEWAPSVYSRSSGGNCPYCQGVRPWPGENDLATQMPLLAAQWHPEKNPGLSPQNVTCGSKRMVWWRCDKGHEWSAEVKSRVNGAGCPYCANKKTLSTYNELASTHPQLAAEWHPTKNGKRMPQDYVAGARAKVWWRCEHGHEWQAMIKSRACGGNGCPFCGGKVVLPGVTDLATLHPQLAAEWHPTKNAPLTPDRVMASSNRYAWWICDKGHEWRAVISARSVNYTGCPYCSGRKVLAGFNDLATVHPKIAAQWHPELNGNLTPEMVTAGSTQKVWWRCMEGHVWKAVIYSRTGKRKTGCPVCAGRVKKISYRGINQSLT